MPKLVVEIETSYDRERQGMSFLEYVEKYKDDFFPTGDRTVISVDEWELRRLPRDPRDNSFVLLKLVRIEE